MIAYAQNHDYISRPGCCVAQESSSSLRFAAGPRMLLLWVKAILLAKIVPKFILTLFKKWKSYPKKVFFLGRLPLLTCSLAVSLDPGPASWHPQRLLHCSSLHLLQGDNQHYDDDDGDDGDNGDGTGAESCYGMKL